MLKTRLIAFPFFESWPSVRPTPVQTKNGSEYYDRAVSRTRQRMGTDARRGTCDTLRIEVHQFIEMQRTVAAMDPSNILVAVSGIGCSWAKQAHEKCR